MTKQKDYYVNLRDNDFFLRLLDNELMFPFLYGIGIFLIYNSLMLVVYGSSKIASNSKIMSEILYITLVSPVHKITSFAEFNSIVIDRSSFKPYE